MSKMIIEKNMGGELSVENVVDGAIFKVKIKAYNEWYYRTIKKLFS